MFLAKRKEKMIFFLFTEANLLVLELSGYFETKSDLLYCILELHFKYLFKDSYIVDAKGKGNIISKPLREDLGLLVSV